jgi:hypothetical protein
MSPEDYYGNSQWSSGSVIARAPSGARTPLLRGLPVEPELGYCAGSKSSPDSVTARAPSRARTPVLHGLPVELGLGYRAGSQQSPDPVTALAPSRARTRVLQSFSTPRAFSTSLRVTIRLTLAAGPLISQSSFPRAARRAPITHRPTLMSCRYCAKFCSREVFRGQKY